MTETKNLIVSMMTNSHRKLYVHGIISFYSTAIGCFIAGLCNQLKILMLAGVLDLALGYHSMILKEDSSVWSTPVVLKGTSSKRGAGNYFLRVMSNPKRGNCGGYRQLLQHSVEGRRYCGIHGSKLPRSARGWNEIQTRLLYCCGHCAWWQECCGRR